jgi:hypothetical protein
MSSGYVRAASAHVGSMQAAAAGVADLSLGRREQHVKGCAWGITAGARVPFEAGSYATTVLRNSCGEAWGPQQAQHGSRTY